MVAAVARARPFLLQSCQVEAEEVDSTSAYVVVSVPFPNKQIIVKKKINQVAINYISKNILMKIKTINFK